MTKALPWNIARVAGDARESAREAARDQGKSVGEWLHGVITDHAAELGVAEREVMRHDHADRLRKPSPRLMREARSDTLSRSQSRSWAIGPLVERDRPLAAAEDDLLEETGGAMERRVLRAERRTSAALSSFAEMLESNEEKREHERRSIDDLAQKLSTIETTLSDRAKGADDNPIKGSLARLEARLEMIGRRSASETEARLRAPGAKRDLEPPHGVEAQLEPEANATAKSEPMRRLEEKLNSILQAVTEQAQRATIVDVPPPPTEATVGLARLAATLEGTTSGVQPAPRRFQDAVAQIAQRQQSLETRSPSLAEAPASRAPADTRSSGPLATPTARPPAASSQMMQHEMKGLARAVEDMRRELLRGREPADRYASDFDGLRADIGTMAKSLDAFAPRESIVTLEQTIKAVADRIEASRDSGIREAVLRPIETMVEDVRRAMGDLDQRQAIGGLETQVQAIAGKLGHLEDAGGAAAKTLAAIQDEVGTLRRAVVERDPRESMGGLEGGLRAVVAKIEHLERGGIATAALTGIQGQVDEIRSLVSATAKRHAAIETIEDRVTTLVERVERQTAARQAPVKADTSQLEGLIRDLGQKIEAARAPDADNGAVEALQEQVGLLAARFEKTESGLPMLAAMERSMRDLFAHLDETRASVATSATQAAREVLRIAADENRARGEPHARDIASLRAIYDEADVRTSSTLNAVHETLEKVVERLSTMETDLNDVRGSRPTRPDAPSPAALMTRSSSERRAALQMSLGAPDPQTDKAFERATMPRPVIGPAPIGPRGKPTDLDDEAGRADFIAAARRAAQSAQNDPSVLAMKRQGSAQGSLTRAGLLARSRDYVTSHKKPVLLGFAALLVIIGTMAIVRGMGLSREEAIADRAGATKVATAVAPARHPAVATPSPAVAGDASGKAAFSPTAMPKVTASLKDPIPGSDPIQTGSIPSLPAFAAQAPAIAPRATLPDGLKAAAESGDKVAQYELGSRYADGRLGPRDMKTAAKWYEKAAAQGIVPAQYRLASLYEKGLGVAQDKARARGLYQQAADAGNPRAMHNLAVMLADGDGKPDYDGAAIWFRKAAQYGIHDSQYNLAILLARGLGTGQSLVQSYQWFAIAAAQNDPDAVKKRDEVGLKLSANDIAVAKALAEAFHPRVASPSAMEVRAPADGWDGAAPASHLNSARAKISSL